MGNRRQEWSDLPMKLCDSVAASTSQREPSPSVNNIFDERTSFFLQYRMLSPDNFNFILGSPWVFFSPQVLFLVIYLLCWIPKSCQRFGQEGNFERIQFNFWVMLLFIESIIFGIRTFRFTFLLELTQLVASLFLYMKLERLLMDNTETSESLKGTNQPVS